MKLKSFSVVNYKVFNERFNIDFSKDCISILTGRNNTGKSTVLEAINRFYMKEGKPQTIPIECFNNKDKDIIFYATFENSTEEIEIVKIYSPESAPKFYDSSNDEINKKHKYYEILEAIQSNQPFYITPSMSPDDINNLIHNIYIEIIKNDLNKLETITPESEEEKYLIQLAKEYKDLKDSYPTFLKKLKNNTDAILDIVSAEVSKDLQLLFSNSELKLKVQGGESNGFSPSDILKTTNSNINIDNSKQEKMALENQGTGLQRMSLVYLIQNMMQNNLMGSNEDKLLLIDEPEAFLHPEAVRALSVSLYKIGKKMPLIISTHSPILIDLSENHTSIQVFRVLDSEAKPLYTSRNKSFDDDDIKNMKILNYVDSYVNEFFFADKILIVEGDTEYLAFKHLSKANNINLHIIRARGKSTIGTLMKILNQFNVDYDVIHDIDNHSKYTSKTLRAQKTNCLNIYRLAQEKKVNIYCSISNFENAIGIGDVSNEKKTLTTYRILNDLVEDPLEINAKKIIEALYEVIVKKDKSTELHSGFIKIADTNVYNKLFDELISSVEEKEKEKEISKL